MTFPRLHLKRHQRARAIIATQLAIAAVCLLMSAITYAQSTDVRVAILSTRADQIDNHLKSTDTDVANLGTKIDRLADELAEMRGEQNDHQWQQWASSGGLSLAAFFLGYRRRTARDEEEE